MSWISIEKEGYPVLTPEESQISMSLSFITSGDASISDCSMIPAGGEVKDMMLKVGKKYFE